MGNAAIYLHPNGFDTSGARLLGRHSAGESFLRGYMRHADVDSFHFWNVAGAKPADLEALVRRIEPPRRPIRWIPRLGRRQLDEPGVLNLPTPALPAEAWRRLPFGSHRYAITGITHTTATANVMNILPNLLIAPLADHDALICTSAAVRAAVERQIELMRDYMRHEYGARRRPEPQRVTIPLGVNCADFATSSEHRRAWRERLNIPPDAIVALYVGRFNVKAKMNPALMALALERAAAKTGQALYWVNSGWAESDHELAIYHAETRKLCPSVNYIEVDGRGADVRFAIWSVADFFISFSDNIQETFGLTPVEAMAAGLPSVVSDWDGYRDTVRHGVDGFRIPTLGPRPGLGGDLAYWYENDWITYDNYVGATGQFAAVDLAAAESAIAALASNSDLRQRMGESARQRAREAFDWSAIVPQYQALWAEQDARRRQAPSLAPPPTGNPFAPDPFTIFQSYPTRSLSNDDCVDLAVGMTWPLARDILSAPLAAYSQFNRPTEEELARVLVHLTNFGPGSVAELRKLVDPGRSNYLERGLIWLNRHGVVTIRSAAEAPETANDRATESCAQPPGQCDTAMES